MGGMRLQGPGTSLSPQARILRTKLKDLQQPGEQGGPPPRSLRPLSHLGSKLWWPQFGTFGAKVGSSSGTGQPKGLW